MLKEFSESISSHYRIVWFYILLIKLNVNVCILLQEKIFKDYLQNSSIHSRNECKSRIETFVDLKNQIQIWREDYKDITNFKVIEIMT